MKCFDHLVINIQLLIRKYTSYIRMYVCSTKQTANTALPGLAFMTQCITKAMLINNYFYNNIFIRMQLNK